MVLRPGPEGPRGFEITYDTYLLHGSAAMLGDDEIAMLGRHICSIVQNTILRPFDELEALVGEPFDCSSITAAWVLGRLVLNGQELGAVEVPVERVRRLASGKVK
jgi:hypothetical protein